MKKIIALCSVIVAVAIIITCFAACGSNKDDVTTTEATTEEVVTQVGNIDDVKLTASLEDEYVLLKNGDEIFQKLKYPIKKNFTIDFEYAEKNFGFKDMNFDGIVDFYMAVGEQEGNVKFYCWLYNATSKQYDYSISLSALKNISVDAYDHIIYSSDAGYYYEYGWVDGDLKVKNVYNKAENVPEKVTQPSNSLVPSKNTAANSDNTQANDTVVNSTAASTESTTQKAQPNTTTTAPVTKGTIQVITDTMPDFDWQ